MRGEWVRTAGFDITKNMLVLKNTPTTNTVIYSENVSSGTNLLITHIGNDIGAIGGWTDNGGCLFSIKINGVNQSIMDNEGNQLGNTSLPRRLGKPIEVRGGDLLEVTGKNPSVATDYEMLITLQGEYGYRRL